MSSTVGCSIVLDILATGKKKKLCLNRKNMCEGLKQAAGIDLGSKNNMCEGPCQEESVEREKEMVKVPWLQVQEKMQMSTAEDACFNKIEGRRLLYTKWDNLQKE